MRLAWMNNSMSRLAAFLVLASVNIAAAQDSTPRALFSITPSDPVVAVQVSFDASFSFDRGGGGSIDFYRWDFGDGSDLVASDMPSALHTYTSPGLFTITLTVTDNDTPANEGVTVRTIVVVAAGGNAGGGPVNVLPTARFTMSTSQSAVGDEVTFDATDSSDADRDKECSTSNAACDDDTDCPTGETCNETLQYAWDFGDGTTQAYTTVATAKHAFGAEGNYEVRLFVCDQATCDLTSTSIDVSESFQQIEVLAAGTNIAPTAVVASGPRLAAVGESLTFDGQLSFDPNGDQLDYAWNIRFENLLIDSVLTAVMTRSFDQLGEYEITLTVCDGRGGCDDADMFTVTITEAPPAIEPPATNPNPGSNLEDPVDSALQRPTLTTCGVGMIPAMFTSMMGMFGMAVVRRRSDR